MSPPLLRYVLDPTGIDPNNYVNSEPHILPDGLFVRAVAPTYGAFFTESVKVYDAATNTLLTRGTQYTCTELLDLVTQAYAKEICYLILINDRAVSSNIRISYQALGGPYTRSADAIVNIYNNFKDDNRPMSWPSIVNKPNVFPPGPHLHDIGDVYGFEYLVFACERIRNAILLSDVPGYEKVLTYVTDQIRLFKQTIESRLNQLEQNNTIIPLVSSDNNGLMSSTDKIILDSLSNAPDKSIILYQGVIERLPAQWKLCDGTNGTPNMTGVAPSGTTFGLAYIQYTANFSTATLVRFTGGTNLVDVLLQTGLVIDLTDTLTNNTFSPVTVTFSLVSMDNLGTVYPNSTRTVVVPANSNLAVTDSFVVSITEGAAGAQFRISAPNDYVGNLGNSMSYYIATTVLAPVLFNLEVTQR